MCKIKEPHKNEGSKVQKLGWSLASRCCAETTRGGWLDVALRARFSVHVNERFYQFFYKLFNNNKVLNSKFLFYLRIKDCFDY